MIKDKGNAGYDLHSLVDLFVLAHSRELIPTGLFLEMPENVYAQIHPRSGLSLNGYDIGAGVIDLSFRGQIQVVFINNSNTTHVIHRGDRIAQLIFHPLVMDIPIDVSNLSETTRGSNGFGSSGS